jgi:magnesium-transporting ATPase (P-type)
MKINAYLYAAANYDAFLVIVECCLFCGIFTYISIWINLLHKAQSANPDAPVPWYLVILPYPIYILTFAECVVTIIMSLFYSYATGTLSRKAWVNTNTTIYLIWIATMIVAWVGMGTYGTILYRLLSKVQKVNPLELKFTRLIFAFSGVGAAYIIFRTYMASIYLSKYVSVTFFIRARHSIQSMIVFAFCIVLIAAVVNTNDIRAAYPAIARKWDAMTEGWKSEKHKSDEA